MTFIKNKKTNKGFTIIEAIVAIFILTVSVSSMLGVTASSIASARYARNEITANYLLQEAVDSIRNSRDTIAFERRESYGDAWGVFLGRYGYPTNKCFSENGCYLDIENFRPDDIGGSDVVDDSAVCSVLKIDQNEGYNCSLGDDSIFTRWVKMETTANPDEIKITAYISWKNESTSTPKIQSLEIYLLNWQK